MTNSQINTLNTTELGCSQISNKTSRNSHPMNSQCMSSDTNAYTKTLKHVKIIGAKIKCKQN